MKSRHVVSILAACLLAAACVYSTSDVQVGQGQSIAGASSASPSPSPECQLRSLDAGTAGDATTVAPGSAVGLVLSAYGAQGLELSGACLATLTPTWSTSGPCVLEGSGWTPSLRAPIGTAVGSSCSARAQAAGVLSDEVRLTVTP